MEVLRGKAWTTVDDGFSRYRIEEAYLVIGSPWRQHDGHGP